MSNLMQGNPTGLVTAMTGKTGKAVANQYVINYPDGTRYFQSYQTIVCKITKEGEILINKDAWMSRTTKKYLAEFLGLNSAQLNILLTNVKTF